MLKSVGMTQKGFRRMMNYECLLYGSISAYARTAGILRHYISHVPCGKIGAYETAFRSPWAAIGIAVMSVFLVVFATMMYSMSKVKRTIPSTP